MALSTALAYAQTATADELDSPKLHGFLSETTLPAEGSADPRKKSKGAPRPADWRVLRVKVKDSRGGTAPACEIEVIQLAYESPKPKQGAIAMFPGLFQNAFVFDLMSKEGVSFARWLMREKGLQVYFVHPRGIGDSCKASRVGLDDVSIDDVQAAMKRIVEIEGQPIYAYGHSKGGIQLQTWLSGITRCGRVGCFSEKAAQDRAKLVKGVVIAGVNVGMSSKVKLSQMKVASFLEYLASKPTMLVTDRVRIASFAKLMQKAFGPVADLMGERALTYRTVLRYIYDIRNVPKEVIAYWLNTGIDTASTQDLHQYAVGIRKGGIQNGSGVKYADALPNILVPVAQISFGRDPLGIPELVERDNYSKIGSPRKRHFVFDDQGHEDFLFNRNLHGSQSEMIDWLMGQEQSERGQGAPLPGVRNR